MVQWCDRSSRSPEDKREVKGLHSTFAKAEAETVQPDKADHLILAPQRVDSAFPASDRYSPCKPHYSTDFAHAQLARLPKSQQLDLVILPGVHGTSGQVVTWLVCGNCMYHFCVDIGVWATWQT